MKGEILKIYYMYNIHKICTIYYIINVPMIFLSCDWNNKMKLC